jgi:protein TonB
MPTVLFEDFAAARPRRRPAILALSAAAHVMIALASVAVSIISPVETPPVPAQAVRVSLDSPPPPPPPPLPRGSALVERLARPRPQPSPSSSRLTPPLAAVDEKPPSRLEVDAPGSETGSEHGVPEGMEGGVPGGVVGGVPGGVLGGVIGGTGTGPIPVTDYDQPARVIRVVKPTYPSEAFTARIQGVVVVEFVIDVTGRVVEARILQSVPILDQAALQAVRQWLFVPAQQRGRPVASLAIAPIEFRIY